MMISGLFNALAQQYKKMRAHIQLVNSINRAIANDDAQTLSRVLGQVELNSAQKEDFVKAIIRRNNVETFTVALRELIDHDVNYSLRETNFSAEGIRLGGAVFTTRTPIVAYAIQENAEDVALMLVSHRRTDLSARIEYNMSAALVSNYSKGPELKDMAAKAGMLRVCGVLCERAVLDDYFKNNPGLKP